MKTKENRDGKTLKGHENSIGDIANYLLYGEPIERYDDKTSQYVLDTEVTKIAKGLWTNYLKSEELRKNEEKIMKNEKAIQSNTQPKIDYTRSN